MRREPSERGRAALGALVPWGHVLRAHVHKLLVLLLGGLLRRAPVLGLLPSRALVLGVPSLTLAGQD